MQHGYGQQQAPPWMPGAPQSDGVSHKRTKTGGSMVRTKYRPPPGYVPPAVETSSYGAWPYGSYPQQQAYYGPFSAQYVQHPTQAYGYPGAYPYQYLPQTTPLNGSQSAYPTKYPPTWPQQHDHATTMPSARTRHNSAPNVAQDTGRGPGPNDELDENDEDYCEFTRPCYYASREAEIVSDFSIGLIHAQTARPSHKALPYSWDEVNQTASKPAPPQQHDSSICVSEYHTEDAKEQELVPVVESHRWEMLEDDPIFRQFAEVDDTLIPIDELVNNFRNRPETARLQAQRDSERQASRIHKTRNVSELSNKKRVFSETGASEDAPEKRARRDQLPNGQQSPHTQDRHVEALQAQEDILARLGVTGVAKPLKPISGQPYLNDAQLRAILDAKSNTPEQEVRSLDTRPPEPAMVEATALRDEPEDDEESDMSMDDEPIQPTILNPNESRYTRLAREYQLSKGRAYSRSGDAESDDDDDE